MTEDVARSKAVVLMMHVLDWAYDQATSGAVELAESYRKTSGGDPEKGIDNLIARHISYAGALGFATNVGGVVTMPITIPLNISSVLTIQMRMIAAIAHLRGYSIQDKKVKTLVFICLTGAGAVSVLQEFGLRVGARLTTRLMARISARSLTNINRAVGYRLLARLGARGSVGLVKALPVLGGLIGGAFDAGVTLGIGKAARKVFHPLYEPDFRELNVPLLPPRSKTRLSSGRATRRLRLAAI